MRKTLLFIAICMVSSTGIAKVKTCDAVRKEILELHIKFLNLNALESARERIDFANNPTQWIDVACYDGIMEGDEDTYEYGLCRLLAQEDHPGGCK